MCNFVDLEMRYVYEHKVGPPPDLALLFFYSSPGWTKTSESLIDHLCSIKFIFPPTFSINN